MGDIKDILGLSRTSSATPAVKPARPTLKKPEGMSREVFQLLVQDSATPGGLPAMPSLSPREGFKEKRARVIGWEWRPFTSSARDDSLTLSHWVKNNDKSAEYAFARFNKKLKALTYSDEEYERHLTHPAWDKSESALLFELCRRFDLRWPVVHDRFPEGRTCASPAPSAYQHSLYHPPSPAVVRYNSTPPAPPAATTKSRPPTLEMSISSPHTPATSTRNHRTTRPPTSARPNHHHPHHQV